MNETDRSVIDGIVVEQDLSFTLTGLRRACRSDDEAQLHALVDEGVLAPSGRGPEDWVFDGASLRVARTALRLAHDLDLSVAGTALVLDLLADIEVLKSRLRHAGLA